MRKLVTIFLCMVLTALQLNAQNRTITGKVLGDNGSPLSGATILAVGSTAKTLTNESGSFTISVSPTTKTLQVSFIGFDQQSISIGKESNYAVTLKDKSSNLDEVVVVGYGTAKKKSEVAGSVVQISGEKVQDRPAANILDALQGQVPGLQIYNSSGEPSNTPSVRLNGVGSLGASSTPLYILDGAPIDPGTVLSLNPEDFESVAVLRDASATSIYGSRAANGVILFTTKKGKANKSQISLQTQYGFSNLVKPTEDMFNSFMNTKQLTDFWIATGYRTQAQVSSLLNTYNADTKWYKTYYRENAPSFQTDLNVSGGGGKTTYYISGSYFNQDGLAYRSGYKRYTLRSNLTTVVNNWMQMGMNLFGGYDERQTNPYGSNSTNRGLSLLAAPFYSPNDANGVPYPNLIPGWNRYNPEYLANTNQGNSNNLQFNPNAYIQLSPVKGLTFKAQGALEFYDFRATTTRLPSFVGSLNNGATNESFSRGSAKTFTNTLEYKFSFADKHNFTALAGQESITSATTDFAGGSTGQTDDRLITVSAGPTGFTASSGKTEYAYLSYFGRLNYNFDSKYFIDVSVRNDQSSRFGRDLRGATFYSVGGLWHAKKEKFLANVSWLNDLNVKATIGTSGNSSIGNYQSLATVGTSLYNSGTTYGISAAGNPLLSWETQRQINFGIQGTIFKKLSFDVEYYDRKTSNMLVGVPFPFTSGFTSVTSNVGSLKNTGINGNLTYAIIKKKESSLNAYVNVGYTNQKITELFQGKQYWIIPNTGVSWAVGQPVSFFYPIFSQVNSQTGLPEWFKPNTNPDLIVNSNRDPKDVTSTFNTAGLQQNTGIKRYAPLTGGFGLSGSYKQFSFVADFSYASGKYMINNDRYFFENPNQFPGFNQSANVLNYWKQAGDVARFPRYGVQFTQFDSRLIEDASFMRLKNLTVAYDVAKNLLAKTKTISGIRFYVVFRNIWTLTNYSGPDPEVDTNVSLGANPNTRQVAVGLNVTF